jgi:hypothetical protein
MHPCSPALEAMVERKMAQARIAEPMLMEPAELERRVYRALSDLSRTRPRIVEFAPQIALKRALDLVSNAARQEWVLPAAHQAAAAAKKGLATA